MIYLGKWQSLVMVSFLALYVNGCGGGSSTSEAVVTVADAQAIKDAQARRRKIYIAHANAVSKSKKEADRAAETIMRTLELFDKAAESKDPAIVDAASSALQSLRRGVEDPTGNEKIVKEFHDAGYVLTGEQVTGFVEATVVDRALTILVKDVNSAILNSGDVNIITEAQAVINQALALITKAQAVIVDARKNIVTLQSTGYASVVDTLTNQLADMTILTEDHSNSSEVPGGTGTYTYTPG